MCFENTWPLRKRRGRLHLGCLSTGAPAERERESEQHSTLVQLQAALSSRDAAWAGRFGGVPAQKPTRDHVLVFVGDSEDAMRAGAAAAAAAGFQRTGVLQGGLAAFSSSAHMQACAVLTHLYMPQIKRSVHLSAQHCCSRSLISCQRVEPSYSR